MEVVLQGSNSLAAPEQKSKAEFRRGLWTAEEDEMLVKYIDKHGTGSWSRVPRLAGLKRSGKSCRLRWLNYLRPDMKRGDFTDEEKSNILALHSQLGNRWSRIAQYLPGRTDNEIKNYWSNSLAAQEQESKAELRQGPWTVEEDQIGWRSFASSSASPSGSDNSTSSVF